MGTSLIEADYRITRIHFTLINDTPHRPMQPTLYIGLLRRAPRAWMKGK